MLKFPSDSDIVSCRLSTTVITGSSATGSRSVLTPRNIVKLSYYYITIRFYYSLYLGPDFELGPGEPLNFGPELWCGSGTRLALSMWRAGSSRSLYLKLSQLFNVQRHGSPIGIQQLFQLYYWFNSVGSFSYTTVLSWKPG